jgi:hypothetical protein
MTMYRTEVEARQFTGEHEEIVSWVNDSDGEAEYMAYTPAVRNGLGLELEGAFPACIMVEVEGCEEYVDEGDWVIKDALGKFHTCTAADFIEMYEEVGK